MGTAVVSSRPKFEKHLFISYAHADNRTTPDDTLGWVTRFHQYLASYLTTNIGEDARIWRDERLRGNDIFANEIVKQFPKTAGAGIHPFSPVSGIRMVHARGPGILQDRSGKGRPDH